MKRYRTLIIAITLLIIAANFGFAAFPKPDGYAQIKMQQGWHGGQLAWYFETYTNDIDFASGYNLLLSPLLDSTIGEEAGTADMYIVRNPIQTQGPIFSAVPGEVSYSGLWQVTYIDWNAGYTKVPIKSLIQIAALEIAGEITLTKLDVVIDAPIVATGPLGGPWNPATSGRYRIKQALVLPNYAQTKIIQLPAFIVNCQNPVTQKVSFGYILITDAYDTTTATLLGANYAPALGDVDQANQVNFDVFNWAQASMPVPLSQLPVLNICPFENNNINKNYSPIAAFDVANRTGLPINTVVNNYDLFEQYKTAGLITNNYSFVVNAPVVGWGAK